MPQNVSFSPGGKPNQNQSESRKPRQEPGAGPLSDRRIQIGILVGAVVIVLISVVFFSGAVGAAANKPGQLTQYMRDKALREKDEVSNDTTAQPIQSDSGKSPLTGTH